MQRVLIFVLLIFIAGTLFSQTNNSYKHVISIDPLSYSVFDKSISVSYAIRLRDKCELTFNPKIHFQSRNKTNDIIFGMGVEDPYWLYETYAMRIGLRRVLVKKMYIEPICYYKYGYFNNRTLTIEDHEGDMFDVSNRLNREYNCGGIIIKSGFKFDKNHFRLNIFYGLGYYIRKYNEKILEIIKWQEPSQYPSTKLSYWKNSPTIHFGLELGFGI